jgi:hypothetical protein
MASIVMVMRRTTSDPLIVSDKAAIVHVLLWGRQTIAFAFSIRDTDTRCCLDNPELGAQADAEAEHLTDEFWQASLQEHGEGAKLAAVIMTFVRKVFDSSFKHTHR